MLSKAENDRILAWKSKTSSALSKHSQVVYEPPMAMHFRYYLWAHEGPMRLPHAVRSTDRVLPQYAGTTQKYLSVYYGWQGNELRVHLDGGYLTFDENGRLDSGAVALRVVETMNAWDLENRAKRMQVPDLKMVRKARDLRNQHRWEPSEADKEVVLGDLLPVGDPDRRPIPVARSGSLETTFSSKPSRQSSSRTTGRSCRGRPRSPR